MSRFAGEIAAAAEITPVLAGPPPGVEVVKRSKDGASWLFILNHSMGDVAVPVHGTELISGRATEGTLAVGAGGAAVVRLTGRL